jgi:AcrR family transcriptional regulator
VTEAISSSRPTASARRQQILDAACECARRSGFHGTRMAEIAQAAGLSVGQIYRYFESKEAIIAAIAAQDVVEMREKFSRLEQSGTPLGEALLNGCSDGVARSRDPRRAALMLEVMAEAARNPQVAAMVQDADAEGRAIRFDIFRQIVPPDCADAELAARAEVLAMLFEGMAIRSVANPDADNADITEVVRSVVRHLLGAAPGPKTG